MVTTRYRPVPIYATYAMFRRALDELHQSGLPTVLDPRAFSSIPPDMARRVVAGFRAVGWVDEQGAPSATLHKLVDARNTGAWEQILREALRDAYAFVPAPWENLTAADLTAAFQDYTGQDGAATKGAKTFFIAAVHDAGIALSPVLAGRAMKAQNDSSVNFRLRAPTSGAKTTHARGHGTNGATPPDNVAQVWNLLALIDEGGMTDKEKDAVLTLLAYLKRRAGSAQQKGR